MGTRLSRCGFRALLTPFHLSFAAIALFLAWRALRLAPWPSAPAKLAFAAIGVSILAAVLLGAAACT